MMSIKKEIIIEIGEHTIILRFKAGEEHLVYKAVCEQADDGRIPFSEDVLDCLYEQLTLERASYENF